MTRRPLPDIVAQRPQPVINPMALEMNKARRLRAIARTQVERAGPAPMKPRTARLKATGSRAAIRWPPPPTVSRRAPGTSSAMVWPFT